MVRQEKKEDKVDSYSTFKARRQQVIQQQDYHRGQISYHKATLAALEQELEQLEHSNQGYEKTLHKEKTLETRLSIQQVADDLAQDSAQIKKKIQESKAQKLYEYMMKGYK
jgi:hypothetical protein